jgi:hypothetical protein
LKIKLRLLASLLLALGLLLSFSFAGCSQPGTTTPVSTEATPGPGGGAVVQSDSIITGEIKAIRQQSSGFAWEIDVLVKSSQDADGLPNPTRDKIGQVITAKTDQDLSSFKTGQDISARVKYSGDVPKPGIFLYIYELKVQ